jgi:hypothetical protein
MRSPFSAGAMVPPNRPIACNRSGLTCRTSGTLRATACRSGWRLEICLEPTIISPSLLMISPSYGCHGERHDRPHLRNDCALCAEAPHPVLHSGRQTQLGGHSSKPPRFFALYCAFTGGLGTAVQQAVSARRAARWARPSVHVKRTGSRDHCGDREWR